MACIGTNRWLGEEMENLEDYVEVAVALGATQFEPLRQAGTFEASLSSCRSGTPPSAALAWF